MVSENILHTLRSAGDYFTVGFLEGGDRFLGALLAHLRDAPLPAYTGTALYPLDPVFAGKHIVRYDYSYSVALDERVLLSSPLTPAERDEVRAAYAEIYPSGKCIEDRFSLGGRGFTHACPECKQFLDRSLPAYLARYRFGGELGEKLSRLSDALIAYVERIQAYLSGFRTERAERLAGAYRRFLKGKAESFFDAFVRIAFVFALDGQDSLGNVDTCLAPYPAEEGSEVLFAELYAAYEKHNAWNFCLGDDPEVAALALSAFAGASRPNFSLKVDEDTPDLVWDACFDAMERGMRPAFYSRKNYAMGLKNAGVNEEDLKEIAYGGCSETMIAGRSNVGSLDAGYNLAQTLVDTLMEEPCERFEDLLAAYERRLRADMRRLTEEVNEEMEGMRRRPQYIRTLLCPPCAETRREYNDGGATYNFSIVSLCALANAADSLYMLNEFVYKTGRFSLSYVRNCINAGRFDEEYLACSRSLKMFGNDNEEADGLAAWVFGVACDELSKYRTAIGDAPFLPACVMFNTALSTGQHTSCTPDGRPAGVTVADSGGAMTGRDRTSPTALLNSLARISPRVALGSWIVNVRLTGGMLRGKDARRALRALILGYFEQGGNQLQINILDREKLVAAIDDDELASTIIVRVGGFSERFSNLSRAFRRQIAARTEY